MNFLNMFQKSTIFTILVVVVFCQIDENDSFMKTAFFTFQVDVALAKLGPKMNFLNKFVFYDVFGMFTRLWPNNAEKLFVDGV